MRGSRARQLDRGHRVGRLRVRSSWATKRTSCAPRSATSRRPIAIASRRGPRKPPCSSGVSVASRRFRPSTSSRATRSTTSSRADFGRAATRKKFERDRIREGPHARQSKASSALVARKRPSHSPQSRHRAHGAPAGERRALCDAVGFLSRMAVGKIARYYDAPARTDELD